MSISILVARSGEAVLRDIYDLASNALAAPFVSAKLIKEYE